MRVFSAVVLMGVAAMLTAGCGDTRSEVPPLEPTEVSATAGADHGPGPIIDPTPVAPKGGGTTIPATYTVKKGEGLMAIARTVYGDAGMYKNIYEANKDKVGPPPTYLLKDGTVLVMPPK
jgi:nucleoid-associated protein YgaU